MKADHAEIIRLLKTVRGQIDGVIKMVGEDKYCIDISHQVLACEAILRKINREIIRCHMHSCVKEAFMSESEDNKEQKINELIDLLGRLK